jgi:hypothetical protein
MFTRADRNRLTSLKREDRSEKQLERIKTDQRTYDVDSDIGSYKYYKSKKDFEFALNDEIKKVEEEYEG